MLNIIILATEQEVERERDKVQLKSSLVTDETVSRVMSG